MATKSRPPSAKLRRNLYWPDDMDNKLETIAKELTQQGVMGLFLSTGEINRTAVIRRLVDEKVKQDPKPTEGGE